MNRRGFLGSLSAALSLAALDPEKLLWVPGKKKIFIPEKPGFDNLSYKGRIVGIATHTIAAGQYGSILVYGSYSYNNNKYMDGPSLHRKVMLNRTVVPGDIVFTHDVTQHPNQLVAPPWYGGSSNVFGSDYTKALRKD